VLREEGKLPQAQACSERVVAALERTLGPESPRLGIPLANLAIILQLQGKWEEARARLASALRVVEAARGSRNTQTARILRVLASVDDQLGDHALALAEAERSLLLWQQAVGPEHADVAEAHDGLGFVHLRAGRYAQARQQFERALALRIKALGAEAPEVAKTLRSLGEVLSLEGKHEESLESYRRALTIDDQNKAAFGIAVSLVGVGSELVALRKATEALPLLERGLALEVEQNRDPVQIAEAKLALAKALFEQGRRARAWQLASEARDTCAGLGEPGATRLAAVNGWLAQHPPQH
jgi:eukaryotic-like serine/threonine-protein kinase